MCKGHKSKSINHAGFILTTILLFSLIACGKQSINTTSSDASTESSGSISVAAVSEQNTDEMDSQAGEGGVLNLEDHYIRRTGDPSNLYWIDDNKTLWGVGSNDCGQLAQGTQDYDFHRENQRIAENVTHIDFSQNRFMIFLTEDGTLYGVGNAGSGALMQYDDFDWLRHTNGNQYFISRPVLLMEDVSYARCGRNDVVAMKEDGTVWIWGTVYAMGRYADENVYFVEKPIQILDNAVLVTGGWHNHAALLKDGSVWTWGYNSAGNCGIEGQELIKDPVCVADHAVMVWTGDLGLHTHHERIEEYGEFYPRQFNNTVIQKQDGSLWACGENIGTTERVVHGQEADFKAIWSSEFHQIESMDYFPEHLTY